MARMSAAQAASERTAPGLVFLSTPPEGPITISPLDGPLPETQYVNFSNIEVIDDQATLILGSDREGRAAELIVPKSKIFPCQERIL
jgi:hypothetical protein